ncbi:MAG: hypothetical protein ACFB14_20740 [Leptolyngbyaceae cyanobacterium]
MSWKPLRDSLPLNIKRLSDAAAESRDAILLSFGFALVLILAVVLTAVLEKEQEN